MPPATVITWPVTCPAARSEHRKATERATSAGVGDLAQRHRGRHLRDRLLREVLRGHRRHGPARGDDVHARPRRRAHDLVLEREREPLADRGLRRGVVGVAGLAEQAGGGGDQDEAAGARRLDVAAERRARSGTWR